MQKRKSVLIVFALISALALGICVSAWNAMGNDWRDNRYEYGYSVQVDGLSGREASGTTTIMVPIPATKRGEFVTIPTRRNVTSTQKLVYKYALRAPERVWGGPSFKNTTETLDNLSIGIWTTFIAETDDGHMMGFKTNESILEDIYFNTGVTVDYIDIFDPIHQNAPILYPAREISEISMKPYGNKERYSSNPTYISYVYISDNIEEGSTNFYISLNANNANGPKEYLGSYFNYVGIKHMGTSTSNAGKMRVRVSLEQTIPHGYGIRPYPKWVQEYE